MDIVTDTRTILRIIIVTKYAKARQLACRNPCNVRKEVVRNPARVLTDQATFMRANGVEITQDRYAEIEVIVFAKNYSKLSGIINEEAAVLISGTVSTEEGEASRILLSDISLLRADSDSSPEEAVHDVTVYIKVTSLSDKRIANLQRMAALNRGNSKVVLFDERTKKYSGMKSILIDPSDKVITKLKSLFSEENVIVK